MEPKISWWSRLRLRTHKSKLGLAAAGLTIVTAAVASTTPLLSLGLFELDRNAQAEAGTPGDDADQIYCDDVDLARVGMRCQNVPLSSSTKLVSNFVIDAVNSNDDDMYTSAKDSLDIKAGVPQDWGWKIDEPADKQDIGNVFVSLEQEGDDYVLYFGLDKLSNNGDAAIGFWFLQNDVAPVTVNGEKVFSAGHQNGDVLVQADLINGGRIGRFDVYTWGAGASNPNLNPPLLNQPVAPSQGDLTLQIKSTDCQGIDVKDGNTTTHVDPHPSACGVANDEVIPAPWPYVFKGSSQGDTAGASDVFPPQSYFEAGLKLNDLFPEGIPCIQSFLAETRTSQSETAELTDFVYGTFDLCSFSVNKSGPTLAKAGDLAAYTIVITNDGALPLTKVAIFDDLVNGDPSMVSGAVSDCGDVLPPTQSCSITYSFNIPTSATAASDFKNSVTATYSGGTGASTNTIVGEAAFITNIFKPGATIDKKVNGSDAPQGTPVVVNQGESVDYTIKVTNTSSVDTPALNCVVKDPTLGIDVSVQLDSGASHTINKSEYQPDPVAEKKNTASVSCTIDSVGGQEFTNKVYKKDSTFIKVLRVDPTITVVKSGDPYSKVGDGVSYDIVITNTTNLSVPQALTLTSISDSLLGDLAGGTGTNAAIVSSDCPVSPATLAAGASCTIKLTRTTQGGDPDPLFNTVTVVASNTFGNSTGPVTDDHSTDLIAPSLDITKECTSGTVRPGQSANFRIRVSNTGNVPLQTTVTDDLTGLNESLLLGTGTCVFDDNPSDGCVEFDVGKTAGTSPVVNTATASWTLPTQFTGMTNADSESAGATCDVETGDATRTLGFWKTHGSDGNRFDIDGDGSNDPIDFGYTCHVAEDHGGFAINLGWKALTSCEDVFGIFWSNPSKDTLGVKRPALCQTKLHASWQLLASILNTRLDNGQAIPTDTVTGLSLIDAMQAALQTTNRKEIIRLQGLLGAYNESGDNVAIQDSDGNLVPNADPTGARAQANLEIGNCN